MAKKKKLKTPVAPKAIRDALGGIGPSFLNPNISPEDQPGFERPPKKTPTKKPVDVGVREKKRIRKQVDRARRADLENTTSVRRDSRVLPPIRKRVIETMLTENLTWDQGLNLLESKFGNQRLSNNVIIDFIDAAREAGFDPDGKAFKEFSHSYLIIGRDRDVARDKKYIESFEAEAARQDRIEAERRPVGPVGAAHYLEQGIKTVKIGDHEFSLEPSTEGEREDVEGTRRRFPNYNAFLAARKRGEVTGRPIKDGKGGVIGIIAETFENFEPESERYIGTESSSAAASRQEESRTKGRALPENYEPEFKRKTAVKIRPSERDAYKKAVSSAMDQWNERNINFMNILYTELKNTGDKIWTPEKVKEISDYLHDKGLLVQDRNVSRLMTSSNISKREAPLHYKPSKKWYKDGFKIFDIYGNENIIVHNFVHQAAKGEIGKTKLESKPKNETLSKIARKAARYGTKAFLPTAMAYTMYDAFTNSIAEALGINPLNVGHKTTLLPEEQEYLETIQDRSKGLEKVRQADESTFRAMEKRPAPLQRSRGFLHLD